MASQEDTETQSDGPEWMYLDDEKDPQGPFSSEDMQQWFEAEYFNDDTEVKVAGTEDEYTAIKKMAVRPAFAGSAPDAEGAVEQKEEVAPEAQPEAEKVDEKVDEKVEEPKPKKIKHTWYYQDQDGKEHGPWSKRQMKHWHKKGFFVHNNCDVRRDDETVFVKFSLRTDPEFKKKPKPEDVRAAAAEAAAAAKSIAAKTPEPATPAEEPKWFYLDQDDKEQGPWTSEEMRAWWNANYLAPTVRVRTEEEKDFSSINSRDCCFTRAVALPPVPATPPTPAAPETPSVAPAPTLPMQGAPQPPVPRVVLPGPANTAFGFRPPYPSFPNAPQYLPPPNHPIMPPMQPGMRPPAPFMNRPLSMSMPSVPSTTPAPEDYAQTAAFNSRSGRFQFSGFGAVPAHLAGKGADNIAVKQHWESKGIAADRQGRQMGHYFNFETWQQNQQPTKRRRK